jgi:hypothetical protein
MENRENVTIEKKAVIKNPSMLYTLLRKREDVVRMSTILVNFRDMMFAATEGCPCDAEMNLEIALKYYNRMDEVDDNTQKVIKGMIGVTKLTFMDSNDKEITSW